MIFVIGLLTLVMVLDCVALILLVLVQLPKKDAGAGLAFGGAASDALFGAGSGTVLTKVTRYSATIFFVLALLLSILQSQFHARTSTQFQRLINQAPGTRMPAPAANPAAAPATTPSAPAGGTNLLLSGHAEATNLPTTPPAAPATAPAATNTAPK